MQKFVGMLALLILFSVECCWSDDLDSGDSSTDNASNAQVSKDIILAAKRQFETLKKRGTVWLKTQQAMDQLVVFEERGSFAEAQKIAEKIAHDCRIIDNQQALEQARYLLATLEQSGFDDDDLYAIRAQLMAADGEAALAVANSLRRDLPLRSQPEVK